MKEIHISQLGTLWRCGEQYRRRYILGEKIPPGVALITGTATHCSVEANLKNKIEKKELLPIDVVKDIARDKVNSEFTSDVKLDDDEKGKGFEIVKGETIDMSISLSTLHYTELAPKIEPVSIEKEFYLSIKGESEYNIAGRIDIIEANSIRDTKTASKLDKEAADRSLQLSMYGLALKTNKKDIKKFYLDMLIKTKQPKAVTLETTRTNEDYSVLLRRIAAAIDQLRKGVFPPCDSSNYLCNSKFCGFWSSCPYVSKKVII